MLSKFVPTTVHAKDLNDCWFLLLSNLFKIGRSCGQRRIAFDFASGFIDYPHTRPLAPQTTVLPPPTTDEEIERHCPNFASLGFKIIDRTYLMTHCYSRSWNLVDELPASLGGITLLNEHVAGGLEIRPGPLAFSCKDLYAYDFSYEYLKGQLRK